VDIKETQSDYSQGFVNASTLATMFLESGESEKTVKPGSAADEKSFRKSFCCVAETFCWHMG
jgi:hypothetical protein